MHAPLTPEFFDRATTEIAQDLLGKFLIRRYNDHEWALMITEVEAYDGPDDKASRAHAGRTEHTEPMFAHAGIFHIWQEPAKETLQDFFDANESRVSTHKTHHKLAIVTGPKDYPAAVLIRSALIMLPTGEIEHIDAPEKITRFLKIESAIDGKQASKKTDLWFEDRDIAIPREHIIKNKRVGVDYAAEWSDALHNFSIEIARNKDLT